MYYQLVHIIEKLVERDIWNIISVFGTFFLGGLNLWFIYKTSQDTQKAIEISDNTRKDQHLPVLIIYWVTVIKQTEDVLHLKVEYKNINFGYFELNSATVDNHHISIDDLQKEPKEGLQETTEVSGEITIKNIPRKIFNTFNRYTVEITYKDIHNRKITSKFSFSHSNEKKDQRYSVRDTKIDYK